VGTSERPGVTRVAPPTHGTPPAARSSSGCSWHQPLKLDYWGSHADAQRRMRLGQRQRQCSDCKLWFWHCEWGRKPRQRSKP